MTVAEDRLTASCSFCRKPHDQVAKLVAGPGVYICDECVDLCGQIIGSPPSMPPGLTTWEESLDLDEVLANLPRMAAAGAQVESNLTCFVKRARARRHLGHNRCRPGDDPAVGVGAILRRGVAELSRPLPP